jgi:hypothetical protein
MATAQGNWIETNQRELMAAVGEVRGLLEGHAQNKGGREAAESQKAAFGKAAPRTLETLCSTFGLSAFERAIVLMCAGVDLDAKFAAACGAAQGDRARSYPTFSLALAALPEPHWSAVTPAGPLRRWRLIECPSQLGASAINGPLAIEERVLHYLTGIQYLDERLAGMLETVESDELVPTHQALARHIAGIWGKAEGQLPLAGVCGADEVSRRAIAAAACSSLSMRLFALAAESLPANAVELEAFTRLWERESALLSGALYIEAESLDRGESRAASQLSRFLERATGAVLLGVRDRWRPLRRPVVWLEVRKPNAEEQRAAWHRLLEQTPETVNGRVDELVCHFHMSLPAIRASVREATADGGQSDALKTRLWNASRLQARSRLDDLAQRIEPAAAWEDLVLPAAETALLRQIAAQVAHRATVYESWGFGVRASRGLGISALFAGPSGTGKTMGAEVLAHSLSLDLYRIDLASVVSKYIGETEKNLRRVFDAAEDSGAILFFDEADALFGKRSEVKDSHDRYANIEISYLLQRMEAYRGLAVLATNMKGALDHAFLRRLRFVVNFPFPDVAQRAEIWRRMFPATTPTEGLEATRLARLDVTGGSIRNIALNAAFLAAAAGEPVRTSHVLEAARAEYAKLEKPLTDAEVGTWR